MEKKGKKIIFNNLDKDFEMCVDDVSIVCKDGQLSISVPSKKAGKASKKSE